MSIKMKELTKLTDTAKSTILYYVKEGLLPQPEKPKPNLHLYDKKCVEIIKFIKYLQRHFGSSIAELKAIIDQKDFDFEKGFETVMETLDVLMGSVHQSSYSRSYISTQYSITDNKLMEYEERGLLFARDGVYTDKELEIVEILLKLEELGMSDKILETYVAQARELSKLEVEITQEYLKNKKEHKGSIKSLLDTTLILKPYIYNMHTLHAYQTTNNRKENL